MRIPNDTGHPYRLDKFVEYQHEAPSVAPVVATAFARRRALALNQQVELAWLHSVAYSEITAALLLDERPTWAKDPEGFWRRSKARLQFGSARVYVKNNDRFPAMVRQFYEATNGKPYDWLRQALTKDTKRSYTAAHKLICGLEYTGRFAADRFLELLIGFGMELEMPYELDWKKNSNLTSGLFNVLYRDEEADEYDRTGRLRPGAERELSEALEMVWKAVQRRYPKQRTPLQIVTGKLCSFRNLFKGARYGGFHHDRQLGFIRAYERVWPSRTSLWAELYEIRREVFPKHLLGEVVGWEGIRKDRKKLWLTTGRTGVEKETR